MAAALDELSFTYFPENYRWSHGLLIGLGKERDFRDKEFRAAIRAAGFRRACLSMECRHTFEP